MTSGLVDLWQFDDDANGTVTGDELRILFIANEGGPGAAGARDSGPVRPPDFLYTVNLGLNASVQWQSGFSITAHELAHLLGAWDLYGPSGSESGGLTVMSGSDGTPDSRETFHLDPWHKMQFGWCEPRIHSLRAGGVATLHAASSSNTDAAVILYDTLRGTGEFFIVEYRTRSWPGGGPYERNLAGEGLVIWHVIQDANHNPPIIEGVRGVRALGAPNLQLGGSTVWGSGSTTPYLRWNDGSEIRVRLHVRPFDAHDGSIAVEWWSEEETWVDFNWPGLPGQPEDGSFAFPFNTLNEGVAASSWGGFLKFKPSSTAEILTINKRLTLEAIGGQVIIGQ
jgi:hypothetical protein